jgi:hypothetical protein
MTETQGMTNYLVGVTGHRDLLPAQVPAIRTALAELLRELPAMHPGRRVQLLCSMADGADLLAADVALDLGVEVVALLTFPEDVCRADLLSDEARRIFDRVMPVATRLELPLPRGVTRAALGREGPIRDWLYRQAAVVLARRCPLVVAIWDGKPTTHAAGSARVVDFRRGLAPPLEITPVPRHLVPSNDAGDLLFEIRCGRSSDPLAAARPPPVQVIGFSGRA